MAIFKNAYLFSSAFPGYPLSLVLFFMHFFIITGNAQGNFDSLYRTLDPVSEDLPDGDKLALHKSFLDSVSGLFDTLNIILANFYVANDLLIDSEYEESLTHLLDIKELARERSDTLVLGRAQHKIATIYSLIQNNAEAIKLFEEALVYNQKARDSQFIAITLEQLGAMHGYEENYKLSQKYYDQAIPMVAQHCPPKSMSTTLSNYGNTLIHQAKYSEAIEVYKEAISIGEELDDLYRIIPAKQNLALAYSNVDSTSKALDLYQYCMSVNKKMSWLDFLIFSYQGLANVYGDMNMPDSSLYYFKNYYHLKDSLFGVTTQTRLNSLRKEFKEKEQENELLQKDYSMLELQRKNTVLLFAGILTLLISTALISIFWYQRRDKEQQFSENLKALNELTRILKVKNALIRDLKKEKLERKMNQPTSISEHSSINLLNTRILTEEDWNSFKTLFDQLYPGYIFNLRKHFPSITEAEERLFLFIKLQLTSRESADILGISPDTIKKTRSRLRKKLGIPKGTDLDVYIRNFPGILTMA